MLCFWDSHDGFRVTAPLHRCALQDNFSYYLQSEDGAEDVEEWVESIKWAKYSALKVHTGHPILRAPRHAPHAAPIVRPCSHIGFPAATRRATSGWTISMQS